MTQFVRPFEPKDREALQQIGADTAFFGDPVEKYLDDRRLFMDGFYAYYTDYEPEHAWVACDGTTVVGFLTGCTDTQRYQRILNRQIIPALFKDWIKGKYHTGTRTWRYCLTGLNAVLRGEIPHPDLSGYPAHLHINLLPGWRSRGLGRQLICACFEQMTGLGIPGIHLETTSMNAAAIRLYEKMGFRLLSARSTRLYAGLVDQPVEIRVYGKYLIPIG